MKRLTPAQSDYVLKKMFNVVGEKFTRTYCRQPQWFLKHSWTPEQEGEYINWLEDYLVKKLKIPKYMAHDSALWHIVEYGWRQER
jgi:hypothetical protein